MRFLANENFPGDAVPHFFGHRGSNCGSRNSGSLSVRIGRICVGREIVLNE